MTLVLAPFRRSVPPARSAPVPRRSAALPWLLVAGTVAQVCVRLWFARARTGPVANPDETGYLVAARWLAGGPGGDLSGNTFYQGGYPLLLSPAYWFAHDPAAVYTTVMVINAVLGAALFPLGYAAARRLGLARRSALPLAWGSALLPATTFFGAFALADAVLPTLVLGWLLALDRFARHGRAADAALASLAAAFAATVHSRGTVLLAVHTAALAAVPLVTALSALTGRLSPKARKAADEHAPPGGRTRCLAEHPPLAAGRVARLTRRLAERLASLRAALPGWRAALVGLAVAAAGRAAGTVLNARLRAELYPGGTRDLAANLTSRLTTSSGQQWALSGAAGQVWYLIVSTWGLAGVGLAVTVAALVRRRTPVPARAMAAVLLAATLGVAYASSAALPDEHRVGNFAYGRYLSCVALAYALAGAAALIRPGARAAVRRALASVAVLAGTGAWVTAYAGDRLRTHAFIAFDFPETTFLTGDRTGLHLPETSIAAIGLLAVLTALGRLPRPPRAAAALALALAAVNLAALTFAMGPSPKRVKPAPPLPGPAVGGVVMDRALDWRVRTMLLYPTWWTRIDVADTRRLHAPASGVCMVVVPLPAGTSTEASWPSHPAGWRPRPGEAWSLRWVAWRDPACDSRR
ncbi:hypothetical protein [Actinomadura fibrosa]|uniref:Integral membrane protein n=1 Tax=Actinomadura fibrosa TaxID=111802 RepID=A0ABW2XMW7_9ACTN|nr:hypothetical protein [Actinomadura fibrosa]